MKQNKIEAGFGHCAKRLERSSSQPLHLLPGIDAAWVPPHTVGGGQTAIQLNFSSYGAENLWQGAGRNFCPGHFIFSVQISR
jgi:hypothetical protein